jgi:hypothetical protein
MMCKGKGSVGLCVYMMVGFGRSMHVWLAKLTLKHTAHKLASLFINTQTIPLLIVVKHLI